MIFAIKSLPLVLLSAFGLVPLPDLFQ